MNPGVPLPELAAALAKLLGPDKPPPDYRRLYNAALSNVFRTTRVRGRLYVPDVPAAAVALGLIDEAEPGISA
jgi:hypothetical protein